MAILFVLFAILRLSGTADKAEFINTTSAASIAASAPLPIAAPTSAPARTGASFIPSPTNITAPCFSLILTRLFILSSGSCLAYISSMPAAFATFFAFSSASPVSIAVKSPCLFISATASLESFLMVSFITIYPIYFPLSASNTSVPYISSPCIGISTLFISRSLLFPQRIFPSDTETSIPFPEISFISITSGIWIFLALTSSIMLTAIGCEDNFSALPAYDKSFSSLIPSAVLTSATEKSPSVTVPVLSITTAFISASASRETPPLNNIPCFEPAPIPEKKASGTLRTRAHGQLITRNVSAVYIQ